MSTVSELQPSARDAACRHDFDTLLEHFLADATVYASGSYEKRGQAEIRALAEDLLGGSRVQRRDPA